MRLFYGFIVRQLRREPLRTWTTVAGIAVGVAVVIAIQLANASSVLGFRAALEAVSGRTSLEITGAGIGVDEDRLAKLEWLRTFGRVSPIIDGDALLRPAGGTMADVEMVRVLGVDILRDRPFREYRLLNETRPRPITTQAFLSLLTDPQAVVLTQAFADRQGLELDSGVELLVGDQRVSLIVRGLLGDEGPAQVLDGNFVLMDIAAAQLALGRLGRVDRVDVQLGDDIGVAEAEQAIAARLPSGLTVQRPERRGAQVEKMLAAFHFNLAALSYIALPRRSVLGLQHGFGIGDYAACRDRHVTDRWGIPPDYSAAVPGRGGELGDGGVCARCAVWLGARPRSGQADFVDGDHVLGRNGGQGAAARCGRCGYGVRRRRAAGDLGGDRAGPRGIAAVAGGHGAKRTRAGHPGALAPAVPDYVDGALSRGILERHAPAGRGVAGLRGVGGPCGGVRGGAAGAAGAVRPPASSRASPRLVARRGCARPHESWRSESDVWRSRSGRWPSASP